MSESSENHAIRVSWYIQLYLWVGVFLLSAIPFFAVVIARFSGRNAVGVLIEALLAVTLLHVLIWWASRRCSAPDLSYWDALKLIAAYMTIGINGSSLILAALCVVAAILASIGITLQGALNGDAEFTQRKFRDVVIFFSKRRIYQ